MSVVADTGALYALVDRSDAWHGRVREWWAATTAEVRVPVTVLPELCYLVAARLGPDAETAIVRAVAAGEFVMEPLEPDDLERAAALMQAYRDLPLGFTDATVIAVAERLESREVLTTDRRHFGVVRPGHARALRLLP